MARARTLIPVTRNTRKKDDSVADSRGYVTRKRTSTELHRNLVRVKEKILRRE